MGFCSCVAALGLKLTICIAVCWVRSSSRSFYCTSESSAAVFLSSELRNFGVRSTYLCEQSGDECKRLEYSKPASSFAFSCCLRKCDCLSCLCTNAAGLDGIARIENTCKALSLACASIVEPLSSSCVLTLLSASCPSTTTTP